MSFAADTARITNENADIEDRKHTSVSVFVAVCSNLRAVVSIEEGAVESRKRGNNCPSMGKCARSMRVFSEYFWHSKGWTPRNEALLEAVVKQVKDSRRPWIITCDANMSPEDLRKVWGFKGGQMFVEAPKEAST